MTFSKLSEYLQKLEKTASRNEITQILAGLFKDASSGEIDKICYLVLGRVAPQYTGIEFNFAEKMMIRAIGYAYKKEIETVTEKFKNIGDLGDVAEKFAEQFKSKTSVSEVYDLLRKVAAEGGEKSQERKLTLIAELLSEVDPLSARYIARIPVGKLRLGFSDVSMMDALSVMEVGDKSARKKIEAAYNVFVDIGKIAQRIKKEGLTGVEKVDAEPGVPIRPSLAERLPSAEKIVEKMDGRFAVEPKLDGFRVQLHVWGSSDKREVKIFSRNLENVTHMYPDLVDAASKLHVKSGIFDGEAIGYNSKTGKFVPFQETVQRKRKYGIEEMAKSIPLKVFVFDSLFLNGKTLLTVPFRERRELMEKELGGEKGDIVLAQHHIVTEADKLRELFNNCIKDGLEGIVAKKLDAPYRAGGRGYHWVKFKKTTEGKITDTIDCVLMGAYRGRGKRAQFGLGAFLIGVPGKGEKYYSISRLGTGLSDEQFRQMYKEVEKLKVEDKPNTYEVDKEAEPDVWVRPQLVLEILADEIS